MQFAEIIEQFSKTDLPHSEVEFAGDVPFDALLPYREQALKDTAAGLELPGFRKGMVPKGVALKRVGEMSVLEEAAELLMREFYPALAHQKHIDAVGRPAISITKLAPGNPVSFIIRTAVYPKVTLPADWRSIAASVPAEAPTPVEEKEMDETLESLRQSRKQGEVVPELTDEFAKSVGAFESLDDLKKKMRQGIGEEKARAAKDKRRGKIIDALLEKTNVDVPQIFVESEIEKILAQLKDDTARFGISFEEYLKRVQKTEENLRTEYRAQAEKRATLQLLLNELGEQEKITTDKEAVEEEMRHALEHFPEADPERLGIHVQTVLRNEKILQMLEQEK